MKILLVIFFILSVHLARANNIYVKITRIDPAVPFSEYLEVGDVAFISSPVDLTSFYESPLNSNRYYSSLIPQIDGYYFQFDIRFPKGSNTIIYQITYSYYNGYQYVTLENDKFIFYNIIGPIARIDNRIVDGSGGESYFEISYTEPYFANGMPDFLPEENVLGGYFSGEFYNPATGSQYGELHFAPATLYDQWASSNNLTGVNTEKTANPDGDCADNLLEYALNLDPNNGNNPQFVEDGNNAIGLPVAKINTTGELELIYPRRTGDQNLLYTVQFSSDLINWTDADFSQELTSPITGWDGWEQVATIDPVNFFSMPSRRFARVKVEWMGL